METLNKYNQLKRYVDNSPASNRMPTPTKTKYFMVSLPIPTVYLVYFFPNLIFNRQK